MTAAKVMDIIFRLPGCDGQAADAVSAYTQVKMEDARNSEVFHDTDGQNHGQKLRTQWFRSNEYCTDILLQDYCGRKKGREHFIGTGMGKVSNWEYLFVHRKKGLFLSVYVDDVKMAGKMQKMTPIAEEINRRQ